MSAIAPFIYIPYAIICVVLALESPINVLAAMERIQQLCHYPTDSDGCCVVGLCA